MAHKAVFFFLASLLFALPFIGHAQGWRIDDIVIEGTRRVNQDIIRSILTVRPGAEVSAEEIDRDVRAIFGLGRFRDVQAEVETRDSATILVYRVTEQPLVRRIDVAGNKALSEEKVRTHLIFKAPELYNAKKISESAQAIRKAYVEEGYLGAVVEPQIELADENEATLTLRITEGEKVRVREIAFDGNTVFSEKELKKFMETKERWFFSWVTGRGTYLEQMLQNDLEILADQYFNRGYVQIKVHQPLISTSPDGKSLDILIEIEEGPQYRVGEVEFDGDLVRDREELRKLVKLSAGDVFSRLLLRESVFALNNLYADQGYAYVNVAPLTKIEQEERLVHLVFDIEQGIQVTIDRIRITGNTKTRDKVIRREMKVLEGEIFSSTGLKESKRKVHNLGFFEEVNVTTAKGEDAAHMEVLVDVKEQPTGTFTVGLGFSSVDGLIAQGSVTQENFLGRALRANLAGSFGSKSTTYQVGVTDPWFLDRNLTLGFDVYKLEREWLDFTKKSTGGDLKLGLPVTEDIRAFFLYRYEEKEIFDVDPGASAFIRKQEGFSTLSSITGSLTRNTTDYRLDPSSGAVSSVSVEFAGLGGTQKFAKYDLDHRHFYPWKWGTVFSAHGHLGYIQEIGGEEIPIDERYFLGGLNSIRGFEPRQVGPRVRSVVDTQNPGEIAVPLDDDFEYLGGDKAAYFNLEYVFPVIKDLGVKGVFFYDAGNAWDRGEGFFSSMRHSVGGGIRWFSPMGPLRLEWGYNLDPREGEPQSYLDFSIGSFF